jgi:tRNA A-37 threonylcarbamoyl transferase component Bud32/tetratricopeptide (TPR) repeat protein
MSDSISDHTRKVSLEKKYCPTCYEQYGGETDLCPDDKTKLSPLDKSPMVGKVFAERYVIDSVLGLGGMSIVYKATHKLMNRTVAIKMLKRKLLEEVVLLERFKVEAQSASSLSHQHIITIYDFGVTSDGEPYLVMDCLEGESLKELIDRSGAVLVEQAVSIFKQICDGLDAAHKKGIIHRDLKPANVVLLKNADDSYQVKLVDFGIAKVLPQEGQQAQHLTQTGEVFGSPIYMSPEQCLGKQLDIRSDLYGLGCLMYETLCGKPPFLGTSFLETMNKHVGEPPQPMSEVAPSRMVPPELEAIVLQCMAKDPAERFASAGELRDHLAAFSMSLPGGTSTNLGTAAKLGATTATGITVQPGVAAQTIAECKRSPWKAVGISLLAVIGAGVAFIFLWQGPANDRGSILNKISWQFAVSSADDAIKRGDYASAESSLKYAQDKAKSLQDGGVRLEATIKEEAALYDKWEGHAAELEAVNKQITQLQVDALHKEYQHRLTMLEALSKGTGDSAVEQTNAKLRSEAQLPGILSTVQRLYGRAMYVEAEDLLTKTLDLEHRMLGQDAPSLVPLETRLADCLVAQRKFPQVRPLLAHAVQVLRKQPGGHESEYAKVLNKLGQFDLDQSNFKQATPELEEALAVARKAAGDEDVLLLCLRSYADLLRQTGKIEQSAKFFAEADAIEKANRK